MIDLANTLIIGYGNPGRLDDGLGPALAEAMKEADISEVTVDSDYQLTVEDAVLLSGHNVVIFADADISGPEPFHFTKLTPVYETSFSSHSVRPEALLGLAQRLFKTTIQGYVLGIRGYEFDDFGENISPKAKKNLEAAIEFIKERIKNRDFSEKSIDPEN